MKNDVGMLLRSKRREQKLTLRALSELTGIDYTLLSKYENGIVNPPPEKLLKIQDALNLPLDDTQISASQLQDADISVRRRLRISRVDDDRFMVSESFFGKLVIKAAQGVCELCGQQFEDCDPFEQESFLEEHFVVWLYSGGTPSVDNVVALCPNCHKRIHMFNYQSDVDALKAAAKSHREKVEAVKNELLRNSTI